MESTNLDKLIIFQYICRCCICFNNGLNFVWCLPANWWILSAFLLFDIWFKYKILADALEGSKLGHKICGRSANKYVLFYIHQGLPCSLNLHICSICMTNANQELFDWSDGLMASHTLWEDDILSSQSFPRLLAVTWVYMGVLSSKFNVSKW